MSEHERNVIIEKKMERMENVRKSVQYMMKKSQNVEMEK
jgi:hypothetical protein